MELDERALDALKEFPVDGALNVLSQFLESNLEHVSNKSAFLCGVMKTYRYVRMLIQYGFCCTLLKATNILSITLKAKEQSQSAGHANTTHNTSSKGS